MINQIYANLNYTIDRMHSILRKIAERGQSLDQLENSSNQLLLSSEEFSPTPCCWRNWWCSRSSSIENDMIEGFKEL